MNRYYVRKFLNRRGHHSGAYVLAHVERAPANATAHYDVETYLEITDCSRRISLAFPMWTKSDRANSIHKARLLADVTAKFATALEAEAEEAAKRPTYVEGGVDGLEDVRTMFEGDLDD